MSYLVSVIIAMLITTILNTSFTVSKIDKNAIADKSIQESELITRAAEEYHLTNNNWPDEVNNCVNAFTALTSSPTYLVNIDDISPFNTNYTTSCNNTHFSLEIQTTSDYYANYIKYQGKLPTIVKPAPDTNTAVITIPKPLSNSLYDKFLALGDSSATATIYQGKNNTIENIRDITLSDGRVVSQVFETRYTIDPTVTTFIPKPTCLVGIPDIEGSPSAIYASNDKAMFGYRVYEDLASSTPTDFAVRVLVFTEDGAVLPKPGTALNLKTFCK
jgi:hypothetical protein